LAWYLNAHIGIVGMIVACHARVCGNGVGAACDKCPLERTTEPYRGIRRLDARVYACACAVV